MIKTVFLIIGLAGHVAAAPTPAEEVAPTERKNERELATVEDADQAAAAPTPGRELFPLYSIKARTRAAARNPAASNTAVNPIMSLANELKGPVKGLEMLALNDDLNTVVKSDSYCTRRHAMARAAGLAAGLSMATVNAPGFAAGSASVKMGTDSGQLVFVPDETKICKGDTVTWTNNKGGPHNVVFDEEAVPEGVDAESISMDDQLADVGATYSKKFDTAGTYGYFCEPHRGAGMTATLIVQ